MNVSVDSVAEALEQIKLRPREFTLLYVALSGCPYCARFDDTIPALWSEINLDGVRSCTLRIPHRGDEFERAKEVFKFKTVPSLNLVIPSSSSSSSSSSELRINPYPSSADDRQVQSIVSWIQPQLYRYNLHVVARRDMDDKLKRNILLAFIRPEREDMNSTVRKIHTHFTNDLIQVKRIHIPKGVSIDRSFGISTLPALLYIDQSHQLHVREGSTKLANHQDTMEWLYRKTYE